MRHLLWLIFAALLAEFAGGGGLFDPRCAGHRGAGAFVPIAHERSMPAVRVSAGHSDEFGST